MTRPDMTLEGRIAEFASRSSLKELEELATFAEVVPTTALGWVTGATPPKGETLLRLQHYLAFKGLTPSDVSQLPNSAFRLGQLIALGILTAEQATDEMGYSAPSGLYRVFQGAELSRERVAVLEQILERYDEAAAAALKNIAIAPFGAAATTPPAPAASTVQAPPVSEVKVATPQPSFAATHTAGAILTTGGLVQQLLLMEAKEAASVRDLLGINQISYLIDNLSEIATR